MRLESGPDNEKGWDPDVYVEDCTKQPYKFDPELDKNAKRLELPVRFARAGDKFLYCAAYNSVDGTCWNCSPAHAQAGKKLEKCIHAK